MQHWESIASSRERSRVGEKNRSGGCTSRRRGGFSRGNAFPASPAPPEGNAATRRDSASRHADKRGHNGGKPGSMRINFPSYVGQFSNLERILRCISISSPAPGPTGWMDRFSWRGHFRYRDAENLLVDLHAEAWAAILGKSDFAPRRPQRFSTIGRSSLT